VLVVSRAEKEDGINVLLLYTPSTVDQYFGSLSACSLDLQSYCIGQGGAGGEDDCFSAILPINDC